MQHANPRLSAPATAHHRFFLHITPSTARIIDGDDHNVYFSHFVDLIKLPSQEAARTHRPRPTIHMLWQLLSETLQTIPDSTL